ncbi:hypothetical protein [Sinisalibacter aestuarii]|nr:hypothetical protein [Sinisalibacter aestuarii]
MARHPRDVPDKIQQAAASAWSKWQRKIDSEPRPEKSHEDFVAHARYVDPDAGKSPRQRMIEKIRRRMQEFPEWYEADPEKMAASVSAHLERIGEILDRELPDAKDPVEVWQIPLSVFNWLVETDEGESFVHGALSAWSSAENFNAANAPGLDPQQRAKLRAPFLDLAPMLLTAVLDEMLQADLWISFAEKFVGPELKYLVMRVQRPVE